MRQRIARGMALVLVLGVLLLVATRGANAEPPAPPIQLKFQHGPIFLAPHEHWVRAIAFAADGKTLLTGGDGCLRAWDAVTGRLKSVYAQDATRGILGIAIAPDSRQAAVVGAMFGNEAVVWDLAANHIGREIPESLEGTQATNAPFVYRGKPIGFRAFNAVAFSPDGKLLAMAGDRVVLRDAAKFDIVATLSQPGKAFKGLAFSADGKVVATGGDDRQVRLWNLPSGTLAATLNGPTAPITALAISADGRRIVAAGSGQRSLFGANPTPIGFLWDWDRPNGAARRIDLGNVNAVAVAFISPTVAVAAAGRELLSFDLAQHERAAQTLWTHSDDIQAVAVSPDGRLIASGGKDRNVDVIEHSTGKLVYRLPALNDGFISVAASTNGKLFATAAHDNHFAKRQLTNAQSFAERYREFFSGEANALRIQPSEVRVWSTTDGKLHARLPIPACQLTSIAYVPGSEELAIAGWLPGQGGMLSLWDTQRAKHVRDFTVGESEVLTIAVSPDGKTLASGDNLGQLNLWEISTGKQLRAQNLNRAIKAVAFSADGKLLAVGQADRTVRIFDAAAATRLHSLASRSPIESLEFSPNGKLLAAGTADPGLELWDLPAGTRSRTLVASGDHFDRMPGFVGFSPDGRFVVCGGHGKDIAVFEADSGRMHQELSGHAHPATAIDFLPDGRLVSAGEERTIRLWDPVGGALLATWISVPADAAQGWQDEWVGFKPTGEFVCSDRADRLLGWHRHGEVTGGAEDSTAGCRRVQSLFEQPQGTR